MAFPNIEGYVVTEKLGSGSYSTVYKAYTKVGGRSVVAIKCVEKSRVKHSGAAVDNLVTEIRLLKSLSHPHIVQMKNFCWDDRNIYIIMEYCNGGDLAKYIRRYGRVPELQVLYFLQQIASALKFLREKGVAHMDLKPHNLLLHKAADGKHTLKVADFGFAAHLAEERGGGGGGGGAGAVRGSPLYMAPEMLAGRYDARVDLWSVGVIMYECLFGRAPYSSTTFRELIDKIQKQTPIEVPRNSSVSAGCRALLTALLQHDPERRISYDQFFADPYLDLDHMPSKENYDKAVELLRRATAAEGAGRAREALAGYRGALRLLLPAARAEPHAARRAALTHRLARYMERAEEIKQYLKLADAPSAPSEEPDRAESPAASAPPAGAMGAETPPAGAGAGVEAAGPRRPPSLACCVGAGHSYSYDFSGGAGGRGGAGTGASGTDDAPSEPTSARAPASEGGAEARFGLRRLLGRAPAHTPPHTPPHTPQPAEPAADACRIQ